MKKIKPRLFAAFLIAVAAILASCETFSASAIPAGIANAPPLNQTGVVSLAPSTESEDSASGDIPLEADTARSTAADTAPLSERETAADTSAADTTDFNAKIFTLVPRFFDLDEKTARDYLAGYGISCTSQYESGGKKDLVSGIEFYGSWDEKNLYILTGCAVTLKVGLGDEAIVSGKTAYLTFDDGPAKENTYKILEILQKYNARATFFVVGNSVKRYGEQFKAIYSAGQSIGCHSYSHVYKSIYASRETFASEVKLWEETVGELDYKLFRFPGGSANAKNYEAYKDIREELNTSDYRAFDWTMSNNDVWSVSRAGDLSPVEYEKKCFSEQLDRLDAAGRPVIILMHETYSSTVEMLPWAIELLTSKGYGFDTLDNYNGDYYQ